MQSCRLFFWFKVIITVVGGCLILFQIRFNIFKECIPLPEKVFDEAIKENYSGKKFDQELNREQVTPFIFCMFM